MKLPHVEKLIKHGIQVRRVKIPAKYGFFSSSLAVYEYKTVYNLYEAVNLNHAENWEIVDYVDFFSNLSLMMYRDLIKSKK